MIRQYLHKKIQSVLFGDRDKFGTKIQESDICWTKWLEFYQEFYFKTQQKGVGNFVNEMGYKILKNIDFSNKFILELGPGNLPHRKFWLNKPKKFYAIDANEEFLSLTKKKVDCEYEGIKVLRSDNIPVTDDSIDIILSFYSLEHIYHLDKMLLEFSRILKKDGMIIGAIPNEGGIAWDWAGI